MADIALPERLRPAFLSLAEALLRIFPESVVAMGGGSMLEARWHHRVSTDVDLFIAPQNLAIAYDRHEGLLYSVLVDALRDAGASLETTWQRRSEVFLKGNYADGTPWSFAEMHYMDPAHPLLDAVEGTGIRAAGLTEIFMGKIAGRAHGASAAMDARRIPIRDCYDIAVCAALAPNILRAILAALPEAARTRIAANFDDAPHDLAERDSKPVVEPRWSVQLAGIPQLIGEAVTTGDLGRLPVAMPMENARTYAQGSGESQCRTG